MSLAANLQLPSGQRKDHCSYCRDDGWVVVDAGNAPKNDEEFAQLSKLRKANPKAQFVVYGDALAPCPYCEQGHTNEFSGYYGAEGWWQGREALKAELKPQPANPALPPGEARRLIKELRQRWGALPLGEEAKP